MHTLLTALWPLSWRAGRCGSKRDEYYGGLLGGAIGGVIIEEGSVIRFLTFRLSMSDTPLDAFSMRACSIKAIGNDPHGPESVQPTTNQLPISCACEGNPWEPHNTHRPHHPLAGRAYNTNYRQFSSSKMVGDSAYIKVCIWVGGWVGGREGGRVGGAGHRGPRVIATR